MVVTTLHALAPSNLSLVVMVFLLENQVVTEGHNFISELLLKMKALVALGLAEPTGSLALRSLTLRPPCPRQFRASPGNERTSQRDVKTLAALNEASEQASTLEAAVSQAVKQASITSNGGTALIKVSYRQAIMVIATILLPKYNFRII